MLKMLFVGFEQRRVRRLASSIEAASRLKIYPATASRLDAENVVDLDSFGAVFVNRGMKESRLLRVLERVRERLPEIPVVLTYANEPDGKAYLYANQYDCMLFSETDRHGRTLNARELADVLKEGLPDSDVTRRLMDLSMSSGPCSTGR
jgi:hypothetical protein